MSLSESNVKEAAANPGGLRLLLASTAVSVTGDGVLIAAAPLMAASLTRDPFQIGLVAAAGYAAWIVAGLPAGALVDRWDRRKAMVVADLARGLVLAGFAAAVMLGVASIPMLVAAIFLVGIGSCFFDPATQSMLPDLAGRDRAVLTRANGALWSIDNVGRSLLGPPLGAAAFAAARALPFGLDALSFAVSAILVRLLPKDNRPKTKETSGDLVRSVKFGISYLARHRELRHLTFGMGAYNFGWNLGFAIFVLLAQEKLGLNAFAYGLLLATGAVGGALSGWITPKAAPRLSAIAAYAIALVAQAIVWVAIATSANAWITGCMIAVLGFLSTAVSIIGGTARQLLTPAELIGRVIAATRLIGIGAAGLGALSGGIISQLAGRLSLSASLTASMYAAAAFTLVCGLIFAVLAARRPS